MTTRRCAPDPEAPMATVKTGPNFPLDPPSTGTRRLERKRITDWRRRILKRDAEVGNQLWESLAQKVVAVSYLAEAMSERLILDDPAEARRAKHIAELATEAVREACQLAKTLAPSVCPRTRK